MAQQAALGHGITACTQTPKTSPCFVTLGVLRQCQTSCNTALHVIGSRRSCTLFLQVELHHCGVYLFKGLTEPSTIVQVNRRKWMRRKFPALQMSNKAKLVGPKQGLLCVIQLLQ